MRTAACKVDVAVRPPQARVSQAKLFVLWKKNSSFFCLRAIVRAKPHSELCDLYNNNTQELCILRKFGIYEKNA